MYTELDPRHEQRDHRSQILSREVYYPGDTIISQNNEGFHAYFIENGLVEVLIHEDQHEIKIAELGIGEIFGEMALIKNELRSATVKAVKQTTVTIISDYDLETKIQSIGDPAMKALLFMYIERLGNSNRGQLNQYKYLAEFQDRMTGILDKSKNGIDEGKRSQFRDEAEPLLVHLEKLLEKYRKS